MANTYNEFIETIFNYLPSDLKDKFLGIDQILEEIPTDKEFVIRPTFNFGISSQYTNLIEVENDVIISLQLFASHSSNVDLVEQSERLYKVLKEIPELRSLNFYWRIDRIDKIKNYDSKYKGISLQITCKKIGVLEDEEESDWAEVDVPLTFTGLDPINTISLNQYGNITQETVDGLQYKLDDGEWQKYVPNTELTISANHTVSFQDTYGLNFSQDYNKDYFKFVMTGRFNANGNIMSLENFNGTFREEIRGGHTFARLFEDCESLLTPPKILCRTYETGNNFFYRMFYNCINLKKAANIYLQEITTNTCYEMYRNCTSLVNPPKVYSIDITDSSTNQFNGFLRECTSLKYGVDFSNLSRAGNYTFAQCYYKCINLETPGKIGSKLLINQASTFSNMYYCCTNLKYGPELDQVINTETTPQQNQTNTFYYMFYSCSNMKYGPSKINLTWLVNNSCSNMFNRCFKVENFMDISSVQQLYGTEGHFQSFYQTCYNLKEIPSEKFLQITGDLPIACFRYAFNECQELTSAPDLPASGTLGNYCYQQMFFNCYKLTRIPKVLPAHTIGDNCYNNMFSNCYSITEVPTISATTFTGTHNLDNIFGACISLQEVPDTFTLPITNLTNYCYQSMFNGCSNLISVPKNLLPATTLAQYCYASMFYGCTKLVEGPRLPATTLAANCYASMFYNCTSLTRIEVNFSAWSPTNATTNWVVNIQNTYGEFVCPSGLPKTRGNNYIPNNWTINNSDDSFARELLYLQNTTAGQYINTQLKFDVEKDYRFVIDAACISNLRSCIISNYNSVGSFNSLGLEFGSGNNAYKPRIYSRLGNLIFDKYSSTALTDGQRYTFVLQYTAETRSYSLTVDGEEVISGQLEKKYISNTAPYPFLMFKDLRTGTELQHPLRIYNCKIYVDDELVEDLVPAMSTLGAICMYDNVEEKLLFNGSTTAFLYSEI